MWNDLTMQQRADVISMAVKAGMRDMRSIRSFYDEALGSRRFKDGGSTKDTTPGMTGMMKATLATAAHFGNPTARRMTNYDTRSYIWPDEYIEDGIFMKPKKGNVYVASYDNLVTPRIQDTGNGLTFINDVWSPENERRSYSQSLKFNNEEDARYFGEHYKEIAPMMHLYAEGGGIKKYVGALEDITYDADNMKFYEKATGKELGDSAILDEVIVNGRNRANDYLTEANDNTSVYNVPHREYNQHLKDRAEQGAREAAIWREEHPNLSAWGDAAASIPLAVASVPLIAGGAEALAGTSAGQAASSALLSLSNLAKGSTIAGAPAWAWADAGLTSAFAAHGANEIAKGNVTPETLLEVAPLLQLTKPTVGIVGSTVERGINSVKNKLPWTYRIPENPNMAYRRMGPLERDWLMEGNELSTRSTNALTKAEEEAARTAATRSGRRIILFKAGAEHGGRKQFAKGQPWNGTTVTHGEEQILAIPGKDLPWVSGRHFHGPQGNGFGVGEIPFEEAPFGSHIDLLTEKGYTGVNPSLLEGSVIYSPFKIFGRNFGYKKLYPKTQKITAENAASVTPEQWTAAQDAAIARGDMAEAQRLRDLHFKVSAPDTKVDIPLWSSSEEPFNSFDLSHFGETDNGFFGYGHYLTPIEKYAATYHPVNRKFYVNVKNPYTGSNDQYFNRVQYVKDRLARRKENVMHNLRDGKLTRFSKKLGINESTSLEDAEHLVDKYIADETVKWNDKYVKYVDEFEGKDGVLSWRDIQGIPNKREGIYKEVVIPRGEQIKSADAVTYNDNGIRIPLGERDNFNINDIRYGLLPFGIGLTGLGLVNGK